MPWKCSRTVLNVCSNRTDDSVLISSINCSSCFFDDTRSVTCVLRNVWRDFQVLAKRAKVKPYSKPLHSLRKSCITDWAAKFPAHVVKEWAGHADIRTTLKYYLKVSESEYDKAAGLLATNYPAAKALNSATQRLDLAANGTLRIDGSFGELTVEGWDRPEVEVTTIRAAATEPDLKLVEITAQRKQLRPDILRRVLCFALLWHALDIIWVALFTVVYLMGTIG